MENEQEGIEIETLNPNEEGIVLPDVEIEDTGVETDVETEVETTEPEVDTEKELLKKGVNAERSKRKAAEKKNRELEARISALEEAAKTPEKSTLDELLESGVDEGIAKSIAQAIDRKQEGSKKAEKELEDLKFKYAISEASKKITDIEEYADEIKDLVDKGLTVEQSYYAITGGNPTINTKSEIEKKVEAKLENRQAKKEMIGNINKSAGATVNSGASQKIKATATEVAIAKAAGMSVEDYLAAKNADNIKSYTDYQNSKK